jgi:diadenylate cyclase
VLERETDLTTIVEMGTNLDAKVSKEILISIFLPYSPIHDGATIVRNGRIIAAGCFLPLTLSTNISKTLGTRHRAAVGLTEETDAAVVVVSEETGEISAVMNGKIEPSLDAPRLRKLISDLFVRQKQERRT